MDSIGNTAFWYAPLPQLLICPEKNQIQAANGEACKFFGMDLPSLATCPVSQLFADCLPDLIVFTEEVMAYGHAWSNALYVGRSLADGQIKTRVEIAARSLPLDSHTQLQLCFQDADELLIQRNRAEAQQHYRSGLRHWQRTEKVFQEFEKENRLILDAAGEGIYGVDANGLTTFLNPATERILGWSANELIGKKIHPIIHHHHADGSHYHVNECPIYQAFREGVTNSMEDEVFWTKDNRAIDVEYTSTPIKDNGHVVGAVVIFRDVTEKKLSQQRLLDALQEVERLKQRLEMENAYLQEEINSEFNHHQIVGKCPAIQNLIQQVEMVAPTNATVLISGESGTGKELIARAIHESSDRSKRSLIRVNCAAIPTELFESEFFGHTKGAFSGAMGDRPGRFELANGGTLFLDEVGEIPLALQGKLLRVLQEQQFERVGESQTRHVDVRIIAATNRDLKRLVDLGEFREDLYFRLNVFPIESVPLRARKEDIPLLAQHLLQKACTRVNKPGLKIPLSQIEHLKSYHWPGNIRELENIIERQVILAQGNILRFDDIVSQTKAELAQHQSRANTVLTDSQLQASEKHNLLLALKKSGGKVFGKGGAAELLGVRPTTLASRIKRHNIDSSVYKRHASQQIKKNTTQGTSK